MHPAILFVTTFTVEPYAFASPRGIAITPDGTKVYVANFLGNSPTLNGSVSVVDVATNTVDTVIESADFNGPFGIAITPDGTKAYVVSFDTVSVINIPANTVDTLPNTPITVESNAFYVAITPDGL